MIYFIVTTSIFNDCPIRKDQYIKGITKLKTIINNNSMVNYEIIIIENNGLRYTYLDNLDCKVYYTNNNTLLTYNKGIKELQDILDCIKYYNINDDDFVVKMTGRYILDDNSEFMNILKNINNINYDCIIKYGSCFDSENIYKCKMDDCISGLIGMRCCYIKQIEMPNSYESVEWKWAKATYLINDENIYILETLGINICPGSNTYFHI